MHFALFLHDIHNAISLFCMQKTDGVGPMVRHAPRFRRHAPAAVVAQRTNASALRFSGYANKTDAAMDHMKRVEAHNLGLWGERREGCCNPVRVEWGAEVGGMHKN